MLTVFLHILARIGIVLLCILAAVLVLILLILFVPVLYGGHVEKHGDGLKVQIKVSWLFRVVYFRFLFGKDGSGGPEYELYILGFPLLRFLKKRKMKKQTSGKKISRKKSSRKKKHKQEDLEIVLEKDYTSKKSLPAGATDTDRIKSGQNTAEQQTNETDNISKTGFFGRIVNAVKKAILTLISKIKTLFNRIRNIFTKLVQAFRKIKDLLAVYTKLRDSGTIARLLQVAGKHGMPIIKHILPRRIRGEVIFGTGDPCSTGEALGAIAAVYPFLPKELTLIPDFEEAVLEADVTFKGHITIAVILYHVIRLILNKDVKKMMKMIRA